MDMIIDFWGCRGTLPVPGSKSVRYGGNTNCVTVRIGKEHFFIFDAGTGIKELSSHLIKENQFPLSATLLITHPHYDHINGIPFFLPLYQKGNKFEIFGPICGEVDFEEIIGGQMDSIYFPVTMSAFASQAHFNSILGNEAFNIADVKVKTIPLNHPGCCLGYRLEYKQKSFCYITDNELHLENSPKYNRSKVNHLIDFIRGTNVLVIDTTYLDQEYSKKAGWGHSCVSQVVDIADKANVKLLCLYHHDPDQTDDDIDLKLNQAISNLNSRNSKVKCIAPCEGERIII